MTDNIKFRDWQRERLKDWRFRFWCLMWEPWYQWARLRIRLRLWWRRNRPQDLIE